MVTTHRSEYGPLFTVSVRHEYHERAGADPSSPESALNERCVGVQLLPTEASTSVARSLHLIVKDAPGVVTVFRDFTRDQALEMHDAPPRLVFRLESRDPLFAAYTDPKPRRPESILYFEASEPALPESAGPVRLHTGAAVSGDDFRDLRALDVELLRELLRLPPEVSDEDIVGFKEPGSDRSPESIGARDRPHSLIGVVSIPLGESASPKEYEIRFSAYRSYWKYYVLDPLATLVEQRGATVVDSRQSVEFEPAEATRFAGGRRAVTFRSKTPLPLKQHSDLVFQLREPGNNGGNGQGAPNGSGRILIRRLPVASVGALERDLVDGQQVMVSDIYINR